MPSVGRTPVTWMKGTRAVWRVEVLGGFSKETLWKDFFVFLNKIFVVLLLFSFYFFPTKLEI